MSGDQTEGGIRRRLIQVMLRDLMRRNGLPQNWIECHTKLADNNGQSSQMSLQLVMKHWDERLVNYLPALQNELLTDIKRFEPNVAEWLIDISWQLVPPNICPYKVLPNKKTWREPAPKPAYEIAETPDLTAKLGDRSAAAVPPSMPLRFVAPIDTIDDGIRSDFASLAANISISEDEIDIRDLQRLFQIRDEALSSTIDDLIPAKAEAEAKDLSLVDYETTQTAKL
jgi:hypothetical protein